MDKNRTEYTTMRILITGSNGFIGKNLSAYLLHKGHKIEGYEYIDGRFPDPKDYDRVIHLGAISDTTEKDVDKILKQNYEFSIKMLELCDTFGTTFMYASSASVYGQGKDFKENSPVDPQSPYAWSKYLFDRFVQSVSEYQVNVQGFRFFNVYGPGEEHKGEQMSVFHKFKKQAIDTGEIKVFKGSKEILRDFIHIGDVCEILEKFLTVDATDIWNVGTGKANSFDYIAQLCAKKWNAKVVEVPLPDNLKNQYQYYTQANVEKLSNTIGEYKFRTVEEFIL